MLYSPFGHIDFISVLALSLDSWWISIHWHAENTSSITKNINLRFLPGSICSQTDKFKHMKFEHYEYDFYRSLLPPTIFLLTTPSPSKINFLLRSPEKQQQHKGCL